MYKMSTGTDTRPLKLAMLRKKVTGHQGIIVVAQLGHVLQTETPKSGPEILVEQNSVTKSVQDIYSYFLSLRSGLTEALRWGIKQQDPSNLLSGCVTYLLIWAWHSIQVPP